MTGLSMSLLFKSLSVDKLEQNVYLANNVSPIQVIQLSSVSGSITSAYSM